MPRHHRVAVLAVASSLASGWERHVVIEERRAYFYAVWGSASDDVWVAGYEGAAAHYDGRAWTEVTLPTAETNVAMDGRCAADAWMVGEAGTILRLVPLR